MKVRLKKLIARWQSNITLIKNPDNKEAEEKFKEAAEAYDVLSNPEKKQRYDQLDTLAWATEVALAGGGGMSMDDIFSQFGDIFSGGGGFEVSLVVADEVALEGTKDQT